MSLSVTESAVQFLLKHVSTEKFPIRLMTQKKAGCGDIAHQFGMGAKKTSDDSVVEIAPGCLILCNFFDHPEYEQATIDLSRQSQGGMPFEKIVVIPKDATLCGCGETARLPEKKI